MACSKSHSRAWTLVSGRSEFGSWFCDLGQLTQPLWFSKMASFQAGQAFVNIPTWTRGCNLKSQVWDVGSPSCESLWTFIFYLKISFKFCLDANFNRQIMLPSLSPDYWVIFFTPRRWTIIYLGPLTTFSICCFPNAPKFENHDKYWTDGLLADWLERWMDGWMGGKEHGGYSQKGLVLNLSSANY